MGNFDDIPQRSDLKNNRFSDITSKDKSLPEKATGLVKKLAGLVTYPMTNPVSQKLEESGETVNRSVQDVSDRVAESGYPAVATGMSIGSEFGKLTPSNLAIGIGGEVAGGALLKNAETPANALSNKFLGTSKKVAESEIRQGAENVGSKYLESGMAGVAGESRASALNKARFEIGKLENEIQKKIGASQATINKSDLASAFDELIGQYDLTKMNPKDVRTITGMKNYFLANQPDKIPVQMANQIKRQLYENIGNSKYLQQFASNPTAVQTQRVIADALREKIAQLIPDIADLNAQQGLAMKVRDSLIPKIAGETGHVLSSVSGDIVDRGALMTAQQLKNVSKARGVGGIVQSGTKK